MTMFAFKRLAFTASLLVLIHSFLPSLVPYVYACLCACVQLCLDVRVTTQMKARVHAFLSMRANGIHGFSVWVSDLTSDGSIPPVNMKAMSSQMRFTIMGQRCHAK
jgi:hypothetical protein